MHPLNRHSLRTLPLTGAVMLAVAPAIAADVTPERLANPEPQNWLMNHRTYDAALFAARQDQQGQRKEPQARVFGRARRHLD